MLGLVCGNTPTIQRPRKTVEALVTALRRRRPTPPHYCLGRLAWSTGGWAQGNDVQAEPQSACVDVTDQ